MQEQNAGIQNRMTVSELEKLLGVSRIYIHFYEREGLLGKRSFEDKYLYYSQEDVEKLRRILVLEKIGMPFFDIKGVLDGSLAFDEAVRRQAEILNKKGKFSGAVEVCRRLEEERGDFFDGEMYLDLIGEIEKEGLSFAGGLRHVIDVEFFIINSVIRRILHYDFLETRKSRGFVNALLLLIFVCIYWAISMKYYEKTSSVWAPVLLFWYAPPLG